MATGRSWVAIGDVHGDADRLERALGAFSDTDDCVVMLGDYINRGTQSRAVLDLLVAAQTAFGERLMLLRGNHEEALLAFLAGGSLADFAAHGGLSTIRSYVEEVGDDVVELFRVQFPDVHRHLLHRMLPFVETDDLLVSHAGFDPNDVGSRRESATHGAGHPLLFQHSGPWPRETTVCGHYVQRSGRPFISPRLICIDTGCGTIPEGPLTAIRLPQRHVMQF